MYLSKGLLTRSSQKGSGKRCAKCPRRQDHRTKWEMGEVEVCGAVFGPSKLPPNFYTVSCVRVCSEASVCDPMDCSPPGSSVHGILQARILEWVTMPSSRGSSQPRDQTCVSCISCFASRFFTTEPPGKPAHTQLHFFKSHSGLFSSKKIEKLRTSHSGKWEWDTMFRELLCPIPLPHHRFSLPAALNLAQRISREYITVQRCSWPWVSPLCHSLLPDPGSHEIPSPWAEIQRPKQTNSYRPRNRAQLQTNYKERSGRKAEGRNKERKRRKKMEGGGAIVFDPSIFPGWNFWNCGD